MIGFTIKKWFFDLWDNLLIIMACNIALDIVAAIPVYVPLLVDPKNGPIAYIIRIVGILLCYVVAIGINGIIGKLSRSESIDRSDFPRFYKRGLLPGLILGTVNIFLAFTIEYAIRFYSSLDSLIGLILMALVFWLGMTWLMLSSYYFPFNAHWETKTKKLFKKSYLVFFDNPAFSVFMGFWSLIVLLLTGVTFSLIPGIGGLLLWHHSCLRMRMYKYDYLEKHPNTPAKEIPWTELLFDENERIGKRTLKNMIFPWK